MKKLGIRVALGLTALAVLFSVFLLYQQPGFLVQLSNQVWACF